MPVYRIFTDENLGRGEKLSITGDEWKHLYKVLRITEGESLTLTNGHGALATGCVLTVSKKEGIVEIEEVKQVKQEPGLLLYQAILRPSKLDWVVEKATELGVQEIVLFPAEKGDIKELSAQRISRLYELCKSALKQSGNLFLPTIRIVNPIPDWHTFPFSAYFGALRGEKVITLQAMKSIEPPLAWIVGPEAGFSPKEENVLLELGAQPFSLGSRTLRAETASLCGLSLLGHSLYERSLKE